MTKRFVFSKPQNALQNTPPALLNLSFDDFLSRHVHTSDGGGKKLEPWDWQRDLAEEMEHEKRLIILKARQIGLTWIAASYALYTALTKRGAWVLVLSQTEDDAKKVLARIKFVYEHLPEELRLATGLNNSSTLEFPGLHSRIEALPSTEKAGRGITATLIIADEHAFHQWAEKNLAALGPAMDAGGQFISVSTANGVGNVFSDLWQRAGQPDSQWRRRFYGYDRHPDRAEDWYEAQAGTYPRPWMIHQEYPRDPDEAFVQTGRPVFDKAMLDQHRALCREPLPPSQWPPNLLRFSASELRVFDLPQTPHRYFAGADVAQGLEHGDYSSLTVFNADALNRPTEVLTLHGHWEPDQFAKHIHAISLLYPGVYAVERNNHGIATLLECKRLGVKGLYYEKPVISPQGVEIEPGKPGWLTSTTSKPLMIDDLSTALRHFQIQLSDETAIPELVFYATEPDGKTNAPPGMWDDRVIRLAIANQMVKRLPGKVSRNRDDGGGGTFLSMGQTL